MKFIKIFSLILALLTGMYMAGCSSAEQTTAKLAYNSGDYKKAEVEFEKETRQNPQNEEAWFYLAMSRARQNKLDGTVAAMNEYKKIGKNTFKSELQTEWSAIFNQGVNSFTQAESFEKAKNNEAAIKGYKEAAVSFQIASTLMPNDTNSVNNAKVSQERVTSLILGPTLTKADEFFNAGKYAEAIAEYKGALEKVGDDRTLKEAVLNGLSVSYLKWGEQLRTANDDTYKTKYSEALPYIEDLAKTNNKDLKITAYDWLVVIYGHLGRTEDATNAMKIRDELKNK